MTFPSELRSESVIAASPVWVQLRDTFHDRPPSGPLSVSLERRAGADWIPLAHRHQLSASGDLAFVGLGRTGNPAAVPPFDVRITVTSPGTVAEAWNGEAALVTTITPWSPAAPSVPGLPDVLRLFPGPAYPFPPGTPLLAGIVVDANDVPVARARVSATETVQNQPRTEEVRTAEGGRFRLPLRWSAGATDVLAAHGPAAGALTVTLPDALSSIHKIVVT